MTDPVPPAVRAFLDAGVAGPCAVAEVEGRAHECVKPWCACECHAPVAEVIPLRRA